MQVLITGANRGIGAALHARFAARGDAAIGTSRGPVKGPEWRQADMREPEQIAALADGIDRLDLLVCNAGVYPDKGHRIEDGYSPEVWDEGLAVNVRGVFLTIQALLSALKTAKGKIAIMSSIMASDAKAPGGAYLYRASKAAALNLGRNLAADLRADGVAVGIYHPGWVRTDMGGSAADIEVDTAADGLVERFDALSLETTGVFEAWDGQPIPF